MTIERDAERQQEFDIAAPSPGTAHGHRGLPARQQYTGRSDGLTASRDLKRNAGKHLSHVARLALERIAKNVGRDARGVRHCGRGLERHLRRRDHVHGGARHAGVVRLHGFPPTAFQ